MRVRDFYPDADGLDERLRELYPQLIFSPDRGVAGDLVRRVSVDGGHGLGTLQIVGWDPAARGHLTPPPPDGSDLGFHVSRDPHVPMDGSGTWFWFPHAEDAVDWLLRSPVVTRRSTTFTVQSPEEWEGLGIDENNQESHVAWVAAEDHEQARMLFRAFLAADDEYAIQLTRMGCIRFTLREARKAAHIRPGCRVFRIT